MHSSVISVLSRAQILPLQTLHQCKFNIYVTIWITVTVCGSQVLFHHNNINLFNTNVKISLFLKLFCIFYIYNIINTDFLPSLLSQQPVCRGNGVPPAFILIQNETIPKAAQKHNKGSISGSSAHSAMKANRPSKLIQQPSPAQPIPS